MNLWLLFCPPPPRYWLAKILSTAWRRLGKVAVSGVLVALSIAVGMALPHADQAAAQGIQQGYSYTERVCQELGQQPRWYNVRDAIPGSDWRTNGGWAIVLIRSANVAPARYSFYNLTQRPRTGNAQTVLTWIRNNEFGTSTILGFRPDDPITAANGDAGIVAGFGSWVIIDRNQDGRLGIEDVYFAGGSWNYQRALFRQDAAAQNYGSAYIRWANMLWCR